MGIPFSHEDVQKVHRHIGTITSAVKFACIIHVISFCILLVVVIALLISVNPDLAEERKALVTPLLRACLKVPRLLVGGSEGAPMPRRGERLDRKEGGVGQGGSSI